MILRPSTVSSFAPLPLPCLLPRLLLWGLVALSLCAGLARLAPSELTPRLLTRLWGALPQYTLGVRGGDPCLRCSVGAGGEPGAGVRLDAPLDIELRPALPGSGPVFVHAFLRHAGRTTRWPIAMEPAADGTLLLSGIVRDLLDPPDSACGVYELIFVIQRSPLPPGYAAVHGAVPRPDRQVLRGAVQVLAPVNP